MDKVVLAYSGGLDTSIIIPWLKENYGYEVIAFCADLGQGEELEPVREKALKSGASKVYIEDLRQEFVTDYIFPVLKMGAIYERKYLLGTSFARPLIAKKMVEIAAKEGAVAVAHGATGKGNDQVRFELTTRAFNPDLKIIAPWREWDIRSREDAIDYAMQHGIEIPVTKEKIYSRDRNIWHISHEGGELEDPANEALDRVYVLTVPPEKAPDQPTYLEIGFEQGRPIAINGKEYGPVELLEELNRLGGANGVGIISMVENRLVGMKSRGVYETPGGTILYAAHQELERLTLDRRTLQFKEQMAIKYAELVYDGNWFSKLKMAMDAFVDETQKTVTGTVKVKLYKGSVTAVASWSPYSLYNEALATFGADEIYNHKDAEGFIKLFGLPLTVQALLNRRIDGK
ncbi:argininosuccinate synthase [Syntrophomonas palmitatica]|uniref:argininosuccinate synthase n=1 Tax=Syntrophomonas palmitatica TaxID=402877 RepID=UPI0006D269CC|nr:argininosuccinate synthase [Syntrophomonas palmitatica]